MSERTNLDIKNAACLHIIHVLQHPTSRPSSKSMQTTMVNAPKTNFSPLQAGKYGKSTQRSTQQCHHANEGKCVLEAERLPALGGLPSWRSKKKHEAEKRQVMHFLSNEEKQTWIEVYVERETAGARECVEDAEAVVQQKQEDMKNAENARLTKREPEKTFQKMMVAIGDSLSDLASPEDGQDGEDEDDKKQSRESWAKMTNQARWWAQSPKRYSSAWKGFGRSKWILTKWHNCVRRMHPTCSEHEKKSTAYSKWGFWQSWNCNWMMSHEHPHRKHLKPFWSVLTLSRE